ncbi:hypothetical protein [Micromonospora sp. HM5-17]|uniref:hypothetical protein n=1 Tax=Micromonospora sp. HM5-17 TaxID=2487710 RepID=UPI00131506DC|nr:hypothetical protein [Micromonospora sp. HM5-17]
MPKKTPMGREAANRIRAAAQRNPNSATARSGFPDRAQQAADRNEERPEQERE